MTYRDLSLLHIDTDLQNISSGYANDQVGEFVGPTIFTEARVANKSDKYRVFDRDTWGRVTPDVRAPGGRANELPPMTFSRDSYYTQEHSLVARVPREETNNADAGLDALGKATRRTTNTILVNRENAMISMALTAANYASGFVVTLSGTSQWSDYTNSVPIADSKTGVDAIWNAIGFKPNRAIIGWQVMRKMEDHPAILNRIRVGTAVGTQTLIQELLDLPPITVARAKKITSNYGRTETIGEWWGKHVLLTYSPDPGMEQPAYGHEFTRPVGFQTGELMPTERWYDQWTKSDIVQISREYDLKFVTVDGSGKSAGPGYLILNAIA